MAIFDHKCRFKFEGNKLGELIFRCPACGEICKQDKVDFWMTREERKEAYKIRLQQIFNKLTPSSLKWRHLDLDVNRPDDDVSEYDGMFLENGKTIAKEDQTTSVVKSGEPGSFEYIMQGLEKTAKKRRKWWCLWLT